LTRRSGVEWGTYYEDDQADRFRLPHAERRQFRELVESQAVGTLQSDLGITGGISEGKRIADFASIYDVKIQPHNCSSPVLRFAAVHLDAAVANFIIQETFPYRPEYYMELVRNPLQPRIREGYLELPTEPGLGVEPDQDVLQRFDSFVFE
jgi:galactonate dehydratase